MDQRRFSWTDVVSLFVCTLVVAAIGAVKIRSDRMVARRASCADNLKILGLGVHNYHSAYKVMPMVSGGTDGGGIDDPLQGNARRLSFLVGLSPFMEQQALWEQIANPLQHGGIIYPPMGPVPWFDPNSYTPWGQRPPIFVCPSDPDSEKFPTASSYVINYGDGILSVGAPIVRVLEPYVVDPASKRGIAIREQHVKFRDILDGLSNTLFLSEAKMGGPQVGKSVDGLPLDPSLAVTARELPGIRYWPEGRNACWADGSLLSIGFQSVLPPNYPSATSPLGELEGVMSASSHHLEGVHVLFADGAVRFVTNRIDAGKNSLPSVASARDEGFAPAGSPSPYGLWGAMGTRASKEIVDREDKNIVEPPRELDAEEIAAIKQQPLRTWTLADGDQEIRARQVEVIRESILVLLTEEDEIKQLRLSELKSEDAYHAVKTSTEEKLAARRSLIEQLQAGVTMLENKEFQDFVDSFVLGDQQRQEALAKLPLHRGALILTFDVAIAELTDNPRSRVVAFDSSGDVVEIRAPGNRMKLRRVGKRWTLAN